MRQGAQAASRHCATENVTVMNITVLYFARLREAMGRAQDLVTLDASVRTLGELRHWLVARGEPWAEAFASIQPLRAALDQVLAQDDALLHSGAEVAFFPPVTGG